MGHWLAWHHLPFLLHRQGSHASALITQDRDHFSRHLKKVKCALKRNLIPDNKYRAATGYIKTLFETNGKSMKNIDMDMDMDMAIIIQREIGMEMYHNKMHHNPAY